MYRCIKLKNPIAHTLLNGNNVVYNTLIMTKENGFLEVRLSRDGGMARYNELCLTSRTLDRITPDGYIAIRTSMASVRAVLPKLEAQGLFVPHPDGKTVQMAFTNYPLYEINISAQAVLTKPAPHELYMKPS